MRDSTRWVTATLFLLALSLIGCGADLSKLPPITIAVPSPSDPPNAAPTKPRATLAIVVTDRVTGAPLAAVAVAVDRDTAAAQHGGTNTDGYVAFEVEHGEHRVTVRSGGDYQDADFTAAVSGNVQRAVALVPAPSPPTVPEPPREPPGAAAPAPTPLPAPVVPAPPQCHELECVREAARRHPRLLEINTFASCVEFTQRALELLGPDWGHVGKTARDGAQTRPRGFVELDAVGSDGHTYRVTGVSHDAIKHRATGQVVDILGNASANEPCDITKLPAGEKCWLPGPAVIIWDLVPAHEWRPFNPFVAAVPVR